MTELITKPATTTSRPGLRGRLGSWANPLTAPDDSAPEPLPYWRWDVIVLVVAVAVGFLVRVSAAQTLSYHIDESASVLAGRMVAETGIPRFPSGVLYLQGALLSYLLVPLHWLGMADIREPMAMRMISVVAGTASVIAIYALGRIMSGRRVIGAVAAILLAIDPVSVEWSGLIRMYALLQLFSLLLVIWFVRAWNEPDNRRWQALFIVTFALGLFTHIAIVLLWGPLILAALLLNPRSLLRERRSLTAMMAISMAAPVFFFGLNAFSKVSARAIGTNVGGLSFVGDHVVSLKVLTNPSLGGWTSLFGDSTIGGLLPFGFLILCGLLVGTYWFGQRRPEEDGDRQALGTLLICYWVPVAAIVFMTTAKQERYAIHLHPFGLLLLVWGTVLLLERRPRLGEQGRRIGYAVAVSLMALVLLSHDVSALYDHSVDPVMSADYVDAMSYVADRHKPGEPVAVVITPPAALLMDNIDDLLFIAGPLGGERSSLYTRLTPDGRFIDYWTGQEAIVSQAEICRLVLMNPGAWIIVDAARMRLKWSFGRAFDAIYGLTYVAHVADGGTLILRPLPAPGRSARSEASCLRAMAKPHEPLLIDAIDPDQAEEILVTFDEVGNPVEAVDEITTAPPPVDDSDLPADPVTDLPEDGEETPDEETGDAPIPTVTQ